MFKTFMSGLSYQAGTMIAQIIVQTAVQTETAQLIIGSVIQRPSQPNGEKETSPIGFTQNKQRPQ